MKSLNRTLSLVLVLVMVFGLFGVASATTFTDSATVQYKEAVDVMTGIGAINGLTDGSFNPKGSITREEAAKLVTYAVLGSTIAKSLTVSSTSFSDVAATRWSAPYIAYCVSKGIINGVGGGKFDPTANVTGYQIAKMMLCAAGYGKQGEFVGSSWDLNVAILANSKGIFAGSKAASFSTAATREEAALYVFNALTKVDVVTYSKNDESYSPVEKGATLAKNTYGMIIKTGVVTGNASTGVTGTNVALATVDSDGTISAIATASTYKVATDLATLGQVVDIFYKDASTVYAVVPVSTTVAVATKITTATAFAAKFGTVTDDSNPVVNFTANYASSSVDAAISGFTTKTTAEIGTYTVYGGELVAYVAVAASTFEKVLAVNATNIVLSTAGTLSTATGSSVVSAYTGIAKGDYVLVTKAGDVYNIIKAKTVEGTVTAYATTDNALTINGVAYPQSANPSYSTALITSPVSNVAAINFKSNTTRLYLNSLGAYVAAEAVAGSATSNVVLATNEYVKTTETTYGSVSTRYIQTVAMDGTVKDYQIASTLSISGTPALFTVGAVDAAGNYSLTSFTATTPAAAGAYAALALNANTAFTSLTSYTALDGNVKAYLTADTQFVFVGDKASTAPAYLSDLVVSTAKGSINQTVAANTSKAIYVVDAEGNKIIKTLFVTANVAVTQSDMVYAATDASIGANALGALYQVYSATTGEKLTINSTNAPTTDSLHTYTKDANGIYTLTAVTTDEQTFVSKFGNKITTSSSGTALTDADATSAIVVDTRTATEIATSGISAITSVSQFSQYVKFNAVVKTDASTGAKTVTIIFVTAPTAAPSATVTVAYAPTTKTLSCDPTSALAGYSLTYQWYSRATAGVTAGTEVAGAISKTLVLASHTSLYYYCVVTVNGTTLTSGTTFAPASSVQAIAAP